MRSTRLLLLVAAAAVSAAPLAHAGDLAPVRTKRIVTGLNLPTFVTHAPGDTSRLFILEKRGVIRIFDLTTNALLPSPFLDIDPLVTGGTSLNDEQGLLGLAFHPDFANNGIFFVNYTAVAGGGDTRVARYKVSGSNPNVADPASALPILTFDQPFANHNGGWIEFGPDGYLYIATGDGGSANDPGGRAQDITDQRLGKMLRIIPNVAGDVPPYTVPSDNPFVGITGDDEIWAYGLRNPWRPSFDRQTGDLWIADVGQNAVEEINFQPAGATAARNYGWRCTEGTSCTGLSGCTCNGSTLTAPIHTYNHVGGLGGGFSITGGYVYRGCAYPALDGTYFFADWSSNNVWSFRYTPTDGKTDFVQRNTQITPSLDGFTVNQIASFGQDANGEMYIVDHGGSTTGQIFKIVPPTGEVTCATPCPGNLTGDNQVDAGDLAFLLSGWGTAAGDINGDGTTDASDLSALLAAWGPCPK